MALISVRQLLDHAAENGYGLPAFNVNNMEQIQGIMEAADERRQPGDPAGLGGRAQVRGRVVPAQARRGRRRDVAATSPIAMHLDHGYEPGGLPAAPSARGFTSVMMDGSLLRGRQDARELRVQRRGHPRVSSRWRTRSA